MKLGLKYPIADLLAHGPSMLLLDELVEYGEEHATCALTVRPHSLFFEDGGVPAWAGVEYMAQTIGAYAGIQRLQDGLPVQIGLLLGTRKYTCRLKQFPAGERLWVKAEQLMRDPSGVCAFACELGQGPDTWARAEIKAYQPHNIDEYLGQVVAAAA